MSGVNWAMAKPRPPRSGLVQLLFSLYPYFSCTRKVKGDKFRQLSHSRVQRTLYDETCIDFGVKGYPLSRFSYSPAITKQPLSLPYAVQYLASTQESTFCVWQVCAKLSSCASAFGCVSECFLNVRTGGFYHQISLNTTSCYTAGTACGLLT